MSLKVGDTIRFITGATGFRNSAIYTPIPVKSNSYAVVVHDFGGEQFRVAVLRYVKSRDSWKPTKVLVHISQASTYKGDKRWARTNLLEKLTLTDMEVG